jgi:tRNA-Thr(GGU) m(6)t(6)A37 methyltransferase TsaA
MRYPIEAIGTIQSPYITKESCPIQGSIEPEGKGIIHVFPEYADGLKDIEAFSHIILLYQFDRAGEVRLIRAPFLDDTPRGVFATRHPCRPNNIGLTIVKLESRKGTSLHVCGIDVLDGTPLVDIKPYVPKFDHMVSANNGWMEDRDIRPKPKGRE